ncbi:hypothetical protein ACLOJK_036632 [Asimina triloba]
MVIITAIEKITILLLPNPKLKKKKKKQQQPGRRSRTQFNSSLSYPLSSYQNRMEFMPLPSSSAAAIAFFLFSFFHFHTLVHVHAQQTYLNNKQLDCYNNLTQTLGYVCNGLNTSCPSYLIFRSDPPFYDSAVLIAYLLGADSKAIARANNITDVEKIPKHTLVIVPVTCSCSGSNFYQHDASYTLKFQGETYLIVSNDTYQGLTTCQAMMNQNPYDSRNLFAGMNLSVPLRCACPTQTQISNGYKYLLTYLTDWKDDVSKIAEMFQVDEQTLLDANKKSVDDDVIFPFTPFLIPLKTQPTTAFTLTPSPPPVEVTPPSILVPADEKGSNTRKRKWVYVGVGIGAGFCVLALAAALLLCCLRRRRYKRAAAVKPNQERRRLEESFIGIGELSGMRSESVFSQGLRQVVGSGSLAVYKFEELQNATNSFSDDVIIKGSVYHGVINGDSAAIKKMKGDVSNEIKILNQVRHSNLIRLSGFCLHQGDTYLVYEFAENGSLSDWLHEKKYKSSASTLSWKQRVQIAYDVADGLNYLHNYANPPYIHKNLKGSNVLLDSNFRAKVANFGLARSVENQQGGLQMTRHVVGTQGYMAPEYLEHGLITPKLDVFALGVLLLELLSGREALANTADEEKSGGLLLSASIMPILKGEDVRGKLKAFIDPCLQHEYPFDLVFSMAQLAMSCVENDLNSRPTTAEVFMSLSKILSSSLDWDPSSENPSSGSFVVAC